MSGGSDDHCATLDVRAASSASFGGDHRGGGRGQQTVGILSTETRERRHGDGSDARWDLRSDLFGDGFDLCVGLRLSFAEDAHLQSVGFLVQVVDALASLVEDELLSQVQVLLERGQVLRFDGVELFDVLLQLELVLFFDESRASVGVGEQRLLLNLRFGNDARDGSDDFLGDLFGTTTRVFIDLLVSGACESNAPIRTVRRSRSRSYLAC